ncbi:MAG: hypothetical protein ACR2PK_09915 [Acidimicrobiales bacterium]
MFNINCQQCSQQDHDGPAELVDSGSIISVHNTAEGPIAYVKCASGHTVVVPYGREWMIDKTPGLFSSHDEAEPAVA